MSSRFERRSLPPTSTGGQSIGRRHPFLVVLAAFALLLVLPVGSLGAANPSCTIVGTPGNDVLVGTSRPDVICGRGGNDIIYGNDGDDILRGGDGDDRIFGGFGFDTITGNAGNDELVGGAQGDVIIGGPGNDVLRGKAGDDRLEGNKGDDDLWGGPDTDECSGGVGDDTIVDCQPWTQLGEDIDGEAAGDHYGESVAMSSDGNTVIIGAPFNDGNDGNGATGHARVYRYNGSTWVQLGEDIDGEAAGDWSGWSVAVSIDGNTVIIGAPFNDGSGAYSGHARVYRYNSSGWVQLGEDIDGEAAGDQSGRSVAMSTDGNTVVVGAQYNDGNGYTSGHARVYRYNGSTWVQLGEDIDGEATNDWSGGSVAMSSDGNTVIVGATDNNGNGYLSGHARIYRYNGSTWAQLGQDIDGERTADQSGRSVAMSSDGNTVVIGANGNDDNGTSSGHARVYRYDGSTWSLYGEDIDGEAVYDNSGNSVGISGDGNTVIIGAAANASNGHARVYRFGGS